MLGGVMFRARTQPAAHASGMLWVGAALAAMMVAAAPFGVLAGEPSTFGRSDPPPNGATTDTSSNSQHGRLPSAALGGWRPIDWAPSSWMRAQRPADKTLYVEATEALRAGRVPHGLSQLEALIVGYPDSPWATRGR